MDFEDLWSWIPGMARPLTAGGEYGFQIKVKKSRYRPGVTQRVPGIKVRRFHDNGTGWW
jgi:hypothetical protein